MRGCDTKNAFYTRIISLEIVEETVANLAEYATVPISLDVHEILDVDRLSSVEGAWPLPVDAIAPYIKDYDATPENGPPKWAGRFDLRYWQLFAAVSNRERVGGAAVAFRAPDIESLEGRDDLALLWDIRVSPTARRHGVGSALLAAVEGWSLLRGARWLTVETQNINVPACLFYLRQGFALQKIVRGAYPEFPQEVQLFLSKRLSARAGYAG